MKSIQQKTSEIQQGIHTLVKAFEMETERIESGVDDMKITARSLEAILGKIEKTTTSLMQISTSTKQQQTSHEQIVSVLHEMSQETLQFQDITQQTLSTTTALSRLAKDLQHTLNVFQIEN